MTPDLAFGITAVSRRGHPSLGAERHSSVDDVEIDVRFDATDAGTNVSVNARIPPGGRDRGGASWVRVIPPWFGAWCARRDPTPHEPRELASLAVAISYLKPAAAARLLASAFGLEPGGNFPEDDRGSRRVDGVPHR